MDKFELLSSVAPAVSRETFERLLLFERRVVEWQRRSSLVSSSQPPEIWTRHIVDSAQLLSIRNDARVFVDVGSGGGFPGLVLAILSFGTKRSFTLVEANQRKAAFLQAIVGELGLDASVSNVRFEQITFDPEIEILTARAVAGLDRLLALISIWLTRGKVGLFMKGQNFAAEVAEARRKWTFDLILHPSVTDPAARILEVSALRRRSRHEP